MTRKSLYMLNIDSVFPFLCLWWVALKDIEPKDIEGWLVMPNFLWVCLDPHEKGIGVWRRMESVPYALLRVWWDFCFVQLCALFWHLEKKLDLASVDLWKMRDAELKQILHSWGEECRACAEKNDYVNLIKELAPKYVEIHPQIELWLQLSVHMDCS